MVVSLISICSVMDHQWCQNDVKVRAFRWVGITNVSTTFWCHLWSTAFLHRWRATWNLSVIHQKGINEKCQWHHLHVCVFPPKSWVRTNQSVRISLVRTIRLFLFCTLTKKHLYLYLSLLWVDRHHIRP